MFQEPKILPWLAAKAGVPFAEAREIWRSVAGENSGEDAEGADGAWRVVRELRRQLRARGRERRRVAEHATEVAWMFPAPLLQTWAECQTQMVLSVWLAWAQATRSVQRLSSPPPALSN